MPPKFDACDSRRCPGARRVTDTAALTVGWCPGALRPMESGDGFIVRIKPRAGALDLDRAEALGMLSRLYGNGLIDFTGRANLQIRGATLESLPPLTRALRALGLLDPSPEAEAVRNVVASPLAGLDERAPRDIGPIVAAVEERLVQDQDLHALPAKWSIVIDDGGPLSLGDVPCDLRFEAVSSDAVHVGLAEDQVRAVCAPEQVADVTAALARLFLEDSTCRRVRDLARARGAASLFARIGLELAASPQLLRVPGTARDLVGWQRGKPVPFFGVAPPFGSLTADDLTQLVSAARSAGARDIRLTPWRVILAAGVDVQNADRLGRAITKTGLIATASDPRLVVTACSGAPACRRATTRTREDAATLAQLIATGASGPLHVSGCAKGCASPAAAPWTLEARDGYYDLVRHGRAADTPVARRLSIEEAAHWISHAQGTRAE